jgi:hypothetical protein
MSNGKTRPKPGDLGEGPERRMENLPTPGVDDDPGDRMIQSPGPAKPPDQDAVGEGAVQELSTDPEGEGLEQREENTQKDNIRAVPQDPLPDPKRRPGKAKPADEA